jgi:hypothetical protein
MRAGNASQFWRYSIAEMGSTSHIAQISHTGGLDQSPFMAIPFFP